MKDLKLKYIDISQFEKEVYPYYIEIFPEEERKPLNIIQSAYVKQYMKIIEILYKNEFVGFMLLNRTKDNGYVVLDYIAILPQYRNNKFGTESLKILLKQEEKNSGVFIEIEKIGLGKTKEANIEREKRKKFWERLGFNKLNFDLWLFGVIYTPYLYSNVKNDENAMIDEILNIYNSIEPIKDNCKIIRKLRYKEINKNNIKIAAKLQFEIFPTSSAYSVYKAKVTEKTKVYI